MNIRKRRGVILVLFIAALGIYQVADGAAGSNCANGATMGISGTTKWVPSGREVASGSLTYSWDTTITIRYYGGDGTSATYDWVIVHHTPKPLDVGRKTIAPNSKETHRASGFRTVTIPSGGGGQNCKSEFAFKSVKCGSGKDKNLHAYYSAATP